MNLSMKFSSALKTGLVTLVIAALIIIANGLVPLPVAFGQGIPSGPCTSNQVSSAPAWLWTGGTLFGCPVGATKQVWTALWAADSDQTAVVQLTAANIIAMNGAPVTILPAPLLGQTILVKDINLEINSSATAFTSGGAVSFVYHGGAVSVVTSTVPAAVVTTTSATTITNLGPLTVTNGQALTQNVGVDITNATAAFATGTGTAKVFIQYRVLTL